MKKYILLILLCMLQGLQAQVKFEAVPSKTTLGLNERLRVEFTMNEDGDNFVPPSFKGFQASGPSQMISNSWVNGVKSYSKTYSFVLAPVAKGTHTVGPASIEIKGRTYRTAPFKITVTNAVKLADPTDPYSGAKPTESGEGVHLIAEISKLNPYINEAIAVTYRLYIADNIAILRDKELSSPEYNDFWSQTFKSQGYTVEEKMFKGKLYRSVVLNQTILYPQKSGRLEIKPLSLELILEVPSGRTDMFGQPLFVQTKKIVTAETKYVNVKPLPENGRPADFTGAVGSFTFSVTPSKTQVGQGSSLQLSVTASGRGNLKLFSLPKPVVPESMEMYDPEHRENFDTRITGMEGNVTDAYTIVPQEKDSFIIKPVSFSYFDPSTGTYKTITSKETAITVTEGTAQGDDSTPVSQKQSVEGEQFRAIAQSTSLRAVGAPDFLGSVLFWILLVAPFLAIPLLIILKKKKQEIDNDVTGNRIRQSNKLAKKYLSEAGSHLGNKEPFYVALEKALHNFLKAKLNIETSEMSKDNIRTLLLSKGALPETVSDFIRIMNNCEFARYAPSSGTAMQQDYESAVAVITALEKQV